MVINLIPDKSDTCTHEAFGHSFSLLTTAYATHTEDFFPPLPPLTAPFPSLTHLSRTSLTPDPAPLGTVIDFFFFFPSDPLNLGWRWVKVGELAAIVRYNGGDGEDEGKRSMQADGWAYSSRNGSQPWRKSKELKGRSNADGHQGPGGLEGRSTLFSCLLFRLFFFLGFPKQ